MVFIFKIIVTLLILSCGYYLSVNLLWESGKVSDEYHEWLNELGTAVMAIVLIGSLVIFFLILIVDFWTAI